MNDSKSEMSLLHQSAMDMVFGGTKKDNLDPKHKETINLLE